ncbi:MAG TPA: secretin N-terminal domain-containing protein, partial [Tepidisphaeraceae bacterium]|nr:secretin N-terminal domain-containing protein [Tepidisphaeraceae bacterium]
PSESPAYGAVAGTTSSTASAVTGDAASAAPVAPEMPAQPTRSSAPATVRTDDAVITADPNTNTIIIAADLATQTKYEQLIRRLDKRRPQVLVECTLVTIDTSGDFSLGVELSQLSDIGSTQMLLFSAFGLSRPDVSTGNLALQPGTGFNGTIISNDVARAVVRALSGNRRVRVLSAPKLLVYDNANGTLASVAEAPFTSVNASNTVSTTSFAGYASAGTSIRITPHISDGDHLQLDYSIQLNAFTSEAANGIPPARKTDALASRIMIPDGATVIVGGLNQARQSESRQGVPFLSDIPILGYAFGTNSISQSNSTLFVFIRPIILRDDKFADLKLLSNRDVEAAQINPDLPTLEPLTVQ